MPEPGRAGGAGWATAPRDVVLVDGPDGGSFLHSQLAQDIDVLGVGESCQSLLLEPTGHVCVLTRVCRQGPERWVLDVDRGHGRRTIERLSRFVLRSKVTLELVDWECRTHVGAGAVAATKGHRGRCATWWMESVDVVDVVAPANEMPDLGGLPEIDELGWDVLRVDARWPRLGVDVEPGDVPSASGVVPRAVSFTKGCYPGQELVERMDSRGVSAPWELRWIPADGRIAGEVLNVVGEDVGVVTSVGTERALARVRRGHEVGRALADAT